MSQKISIPVAEDTKPAWSWHNDAWDIFLWAWPQKLVLVFLVGPSEHKHWIFYAPKDKPFPGEKPSLGLVATEGKSILIVRLVWENLEVALDPDKPSLESREHATEMFRRGHASRGNSVLTTLPPKDSHGELQSHLSPQGRMTTLSKAGWLRSFKPTTSGLLTEEAQKKIPIGQGWVPISLHPVRQEPLVALAFDPPLRNGKKVGAHGPSISFRTRADNQDTQFLGRLKISLPFSSDLGSKEIEWSWTRLGGVLFGGHPQLSYAFGHSPYSLGEDSKATSWTSWTFQPTKTDSSLRSWPSSNHLRCCLEDTWGNLWGFDPQTQALTRVCPSEEV